jgi:hypothetical protein
VTFETVNALGAGQYFDGLAVNCTVADDLGFVIGDPAEASLAAALGIIETGSCPPTAFRSAFSAPAAHHQDIPLDAAAQAAQRLLGAY